MTFALIMEIKALFYLNHKMNTLSVWLVSLLYAKLNAVKVLILLVNIFFISWFWLIYISRKMIVCVLTLDSLLDCVFVSLLHSTLHGLFAQCDLKVVNISAAPVKTTVSKNRPWSTNSPFLLCILLHLSRNVSGISEISHTSHESAFTVHIYHPAYLFVHEHSSHCSSL